MAEVCGGCDLQLHVCLFSIDALQLGDSIPPRYSSPNETAATFKEIAWAANGRFHWFGETGVTGEYFLYVFNLSSLAPPQELHVRDCSFQNGNHV